MSVISATSISCRTMADGSLRIVAEVSTIDAQAAFALFGLPGQPMALAALTQEAAKDTAQQAVIKQSASVVGDDSKDSLKGGQLSKLAGRWCSSYQFHEWIRPVYDLLMGGDGSGSGDIDCYPAITIDQFNTHAIYVLCGIESRVELDHDKVAAQKFHTLIRIPYGEWLKKND